ncbi:MAG TPA: phosphatidylserine decarboxylase [Opitutaceae bacterium]|nr:phosphatidylserine decarboxylase [Opitutaceae bacterium]
MPEAAAASASAIRFYNRYTKTYEMENIYGERWLRLMYDNPAGKFFLWAIVKRALFSHLYGWQMNKRVSANKILPFVVKYNLNVEEFAKSPFDFKNFNEFFYRALKKESRPVSADPNAVIFPADARHLAFPNVDEADGFYAKGSKFTLLDLLDDPALAKKFEGGSMVISRLCPVDYHRFHFCLSGNPSEPELIRGPLFSVSPIALRKRIQYLAQNKRMKTIIETDRAGTVVQMEIGATNVGSIKQTFITGRPVAQGDEKGLFKFGGSCVITLFRRGAVTLDEDIVRESRNHVETYARMGDRMAVIN